MKDITEYLQKCEGCTHFCEIYVYEMQTYNFIQGIDVHIADLYEVPTWKLREPSLPVSCIMCLQVQQIHLFK